MSRLDAARGECGGQMGGKRKANERFAGERKGEGVGVGFLLVPAPVCRICTQSLP